MSQSTSARWEILCTILPSALGTARDPGAPRGERAMAAKLAAWVLQRGYFDERELTDVVATAKECLPEVAVFGPLLAALVRVVAPARLRPVVARLASAAHEGGHHGSAYLLAVLEARDRLRLGGLATPAGWLALARRPPDARWVPSRDSLGEDAEVAVQALQVALAECAPEAARVVLARWLVELS